MKNLMSPPSRFLGRRRGYNLYTFDCPLLRSHWRNGNTGRQHSRYRPRMRPAFHSATGARDVRQADTGGGQFDYPPSARTPEEIAMKLLIDIIEFPNDLNRNCSDPSCDLDASVFTTENDGEKKPWCTGHAHVEVACFMVGL